MENETDIREAHEDDLSGIIELYDQLVTDDARMEKDVLTVEWKQILSKRDWIRYYVAVKDGRLVATCNIAIIPNLTRAIRPFAVIENVVTHTAYRKQGFGEKVMKMAIDFARSRNCYKVMLLSNSKREEAHLFYRALGFSDTKKVGFVMDL
jgi:GNAT superfamily N-acetyltransferase